MKTLALVCFRARAASIDARARARGLVAPETVLHVRRALWSLHALAYTRTCPERLAAHARAEFVDRCEVGALGAKGLSDPVGADPRPSALRAVVPSLPMHACARASASRALRPGPFFSSSNFFARRIFAPASAAVAWDVFPAPRAGAALDEPHHFRIWSASVTENL